MYQRWMDSVRRGDVLKSGSGTLRVVRDVRKDGSGHLYSVTFAIRHCSWTGRCYTILTYNDLYQSGYRSTRRRVSLRKKIDRAIAKAISDRDNRRLTCCDVRGVD